MVAEGSCSGAREEGRKGFSAVAEEKTVTQPAH